MLWRVRGKVVSDCPLRGPAIVAANHVSFFDSVVLIMSMRRTLSFVGKAEHLDSWKTRRVLPALGMIPVDRSDGRRALVALKTATGLLRAGKLFAIYPEGTRSGTGTCTPVKLAPPISRWPRAWPSVAGIDPRPPRERVHVSVCT